MVESIREERKVFVKNKKTLRELNMIKKYSKGDEEMKFRNLENDKTFNKDTRN